VTDKVGDSVNHDSDWRARSLAYHESQQGSRQWRAFLGVLMRELKATAGDGAADFLRHLGACMAETMPLTPHDTLEELAAAINVHWQQINWGWCAMTAMPEGIHIQHGAWPRVDVRVEGEWPASLAAVLEGVYGAWLRQQGGDTGIRVRSVRVSADAPLEFLYG
jgi:hypothetical protein